MMDEGGRTMLWLNDGTGHFTDATGVRMPGVLVEFSWKLEFVDLDNDYAHDQRISFGHERLHQQPQENATHLPTLYNGRG